MKISKTNLVNLFVELGYAVAPRWKEEKLLKKIQDIPSLGISDDDREKLGEQAELLDALIKAVEAEETIGFVSDAEEVKDVVLDEVEEPEEEPEEELGLEEEVEEWGEPEDLEEEEEESPFAPEPEEEPEPKKLAKKKAPAKKKPEPEPEDDPAPELTEELVEAMPKEELFQLNEDMKLGLKKKDFKNLKHYRTAVIQALFYTKNREVDPSASGLLPKSRKGSMAHAINTILFMEDGWVDEVEVAERAGYPLEQVRGHLAWLKKENFVKKETTRRFCLIR